MVHLYININTVTAWKKSHFILLERLNICMVNNLLVAFYAFAKGMLTSLSVDEILLPKYVNLSTNFRGLPLKVKIAPSHLKHMNSILFVFT